MLPHETTAVGLIDRRAWRAAAAVFVAALAIYLPKTVNHFGYTFDDGPYILQNSYLRSWSGALGEFGRDQARIYRPLRSLALATLTGLFGQDRALPFELAGMLFHAVCSAVFTLIVWWLAADPPAALVAGLIFALHPVHADRVANIMGSFDLLGLALGWTAWLLALTAVRGGRPRLAWGAGLAMLAGCFASEEALMVVPLAALSFVLWPAGAGETSAKGKDLARRHGGHGVRKASAKKHSWWRRFYALIFLAVAAGAYFAVRTHVLGGVARHKAYPAGDLINTIWTTSIVIWRYLGLLVFPVGLSMAYGPVIHTRPDALVLVALLGLIGLGAAALAAFRRAPLATMALGWFFLGLAPFSNLLPNDALMAERFLYAGLGGFALAGGVLFAALLRQRRKAASAVLAAILALYGAGVVTQCRAWGNPARLWTEAATREPNSFLATNQAASEMLMVQRLRDAERFSQQANRLDPRRPEPLLNLAVIAFADRKRDEGMRFLETAIRTAPGFGYSYDLLALRLSFDHDADGAAKAAAVAARLHPPGDPAREYVTALLLVSAGLCDQAAPAIEAVLGTHPRAPEYSVTMALREKCRP
jgi:tetratricopeptide (TPR) repeat protein